MMPWFVPAMAKPPGSDVGMGSAGLGVPRHPAFCGRSAPRSTGRAAARQCRERDDLVGRAGDVRRSRRGSRTRPARPVRPWPCAGAAHARPRPRCRARRAASPARPSSAAARNTRVADGSASRTWRAPCRSISSSTVRPSARAFVDGLARSAVAEARCARSRARGARRPRSCGRTRRRPRRSSARRPPRPGAARRVVADTESRISGWCVLICAATVPLPTAVGPASTTRRLRPGARAGAPGQALVEERRSSPRAGASRGRRSRLTGEISRSCEDAVALAFADRGDAVRNSGTRMAPAGEAGSAGRATQQLLRRDRPASSTSLLERCALAAGRDGAARTPRRGRPRVGAHARRGSGRRPVRKVRESGMSITT